MQIEMYSQVLYHLVNMARSMKFAGFWGLTLYIKQHEINPLMYDGAVMACDGMMPREMTLLYLKTKGRNEYGNFDENYVECIATGIKNLVEGENADNVLALAMAYTPKSIKKEVNDKFYEACRINAEKNRELLCSQTVRSEKTNLAVCLISAEKRSTSLRCLYSSLSYSHGSTRLDFGGTTGV